ncbi:MAG: hypothetical protein ACXWZB_01790 [Gaiellaceae bacterium]
MKIATLITICVVAAAGSTAGVAAKPPAPRLLVMKTAPLALKGSSFKPRELVRLVVISGAVTVRRTLRASATGTFSAAFANVAVDRCNGWMTARATGRQGSAAVAKVGPMPQCPPAP